MRDPDNAHWRDSARAAKFFVVEAPAAFPLILFLLHIRMWTLYIALSITAFFVILHKFGFTIPVFKRWLRVLIAGPLRSGTPWWLMNGK